MYPSYFNAYIPFQNFSKNTYKGAELGISYQQNIGTLRLAVGVNALYATSKVKKRDQLYSDDYRYRTGKPVNARYGLVVDGITGAGTSYHG